VNSRRSGELSLSQYDSVAMPSNDSATPRSAPPIPNSYWVEPGRLLAGEYPGHMSAVEAAERIQRLLNAGVNTFIDLTEEGELPSYVTLFPTDQPLPIEHHRLPITDHGVPRSPQLMIQILDTIESALSAGRRVYVHCHAGIGRTGTTIGCYLIRRGLTGDQALEHLQQLWSQCARSHRWPTIPETDDQYGFVRGWSEPQRQARMHAQLTLEQRAQGAMLGLAIGDALTTMLASTAGDPARLAPESFAAAWVCEAGTNALMTQVVAESLLARRGHDIDDQMNRYLQSLRAHPQLAWSAHFKRAIGGWQFSRRRLAGTHDPSNLDPHSLARCLAVALYSFKHSNAAMDLAVEVSRTTQQSPVVLDACRLWTAVLLDALSGVPVSQLFEGSASVRCRARKLRPELEPLTQRRWSELALRDPDALSCIAKALLAVQDTPTFASALMRCLGDSASAALCGSLAGAHYGVEAIPAAWRFALRSRESLQSLATRLVS
jgi:ADP-ribosylglycohydrolase